MDRTGREAGQTVLASEGYSSTAGAKKGIRSVQANCTDPARFDSTSTSSGKFRFNLTAKNRQVIGQSQGYTTASARDKGIEAVSRAAKGATIVDLAE